MSDYVTNTPKQMFYFIFKCFPSAHAHFQEWLTQLRHIYAIIGKTSSVIIYPSIIIILFFRTQIERLFGLISIFVDKSFTMKGNLKSTTARSLPVENLLPMNLGSIISYLQ